MSTNINKEIENIIKLDSLTAKIYNTLYQLEINDKKNSQEFKEQLESLKLTLKTQRKAINKLDITADTCLEFVQYIAATPLRRYLDKDNIIEINNFRNRLYNYFTEKIAKKNADFDFFIISELDLQTTILDSYNLQKEIVNYPYLKKDILKKNYNYAYLYPELEEKMLMGNFTSGNENTLTIDQELRFDEYKLFIDDIIDTEIEALKFDFNNLTNSILLIKDDSMTKTNFLNCIIHKAELKGNLTLQNILGNSFNQIYEFNKQLHDNYSQEERDKNSIAIGLIKEAIKESILEKNEYFYANNCAKKIYTKK